MPSSKKGAPPNTLINNKRENRNTGVSASALEEYLRGDGNLPEVTENTSVSETAQLDQSIKEDQEEYSQTHEIKTEVLREDSKPKSEVRPTKTRHNSPKTNEKIEIKPSEEIQPSEEIKQNEESQKTRKNYYLDVETSDALEDMLLVARRHIRRKMDKTVSESALLEIIIETFKENEFANQPNFLKIVETYLNRKINGN